jgi:hypothetical protein
MCRESEAKMIKGKRAFTKVDAVEVELAVACVGKKFSLI